MPFCSTIFGSNFFTVSMSYAIHILNGMIECSIYIADLSLCVDLVFFPVGVRRLELLDSSLLRADQNCITKHVHRVGLLLQIMRNLGTLMTFELRGPLWYK